MFYKKGNLKNVAALTGNHLCRTLHFNEVEGWKAETFKKALVRKWSSKLLFLKILQISQEKDLCWSLF